MKITINNDVFQVFSLIEGKLGKNNLFFVGGFVRDTLLGRITDDLDFATPLDPQVVFSMFPYAHFFQKFGTVSFKINQFHITIASFRKESDYKDFRHPDDVVFVKSLKEDSKRRDFTINCLYVNSSLEVLDPTKRGLVDLKNKKIFLIGNNKKRLADDPLRILRAYRFCYELNFLISKKLERAIKKNLELIKQLNPAKIREEIEKCPIEKRKNLINDLNLDFVYNSKI